MRGSKPILVEIPQFSSLSIDTNIEVAGKTHLVKHNTLLFIAYTWQQHIRDRKHTPYQTQWDEVAEWLRRWTANPMCSARMGSNPILVEIPYFLAFIGMAGKTHLVKHNTLLFIAYTWQQHIRDRKHTLYQTQWDEVAEWLRRWTANPMCSARMGSNPILVEMPYFLAFIGMAGKTHLVKHNTLLFIAYTWQQHIRDRKHTLYQTQWDEVAEWLRRWTANPMCSGRMGSNPILVEMPQFS